MTIENQLTKKQRQEATKRLLSNPIVETLDVKAVVQATYHKDNPTLVMPSCLDFTCPWR